MPFVAGETLKQILRYEQKKTIPALMPIFWSICQTVAYIHSKGIIHRDLKPENILVGKFGEVIILDWGLAMIMEGDLENSFEEGKEESSELTHPGKIVGTLAYMAPERALKSLVSYQTDIYALGVILYQILTLHLPFERVSIKEFRKKHHLEKLIEPEELAPYRDVPPRLSRIVKKCLDPFQENRYQTMESMIYDLKNHLEGRSEWFEKARLHTQRKKDWEFQENILISKHIALTRTTEAAEWFSVMLSRMAFAENTRLETKIYLGERSEGIGFLLSVPESEEREHPLKGYCLWLGTEENPYSLLFRNTIEVMHIPDIFLKKNCWHLLALEKIDNHIHFFLNNSHRFTYVSYLPLMGTHVGIIAQDADYLMEEIIVSIGGQNLQVSCLSIPDAFLANKDYKHALAEYRRIGYSFPGHAEGREALFRAGITLLEQAKNAKSEKKAQIFFAASLEEFAKLHTTPGAPLEYLGKSLVYEALKENIEEIKCLEFALRRYHKHPLIGAIKEQIVYRMHESSQNDRKSAYQLILISLRQLPEIIARTDFQRLLKHLTSHWESLPFLEQPADPSLFGKEKSEYERKVHEIQFCVPLAFWLTASHTLLEIYHDLCHLFPLDVSALGNLFYVFFELGSHRLAETFMDQMESNKEQMPPEILKDFEEMMALFDPLRICHRNSLEEGLKSFFKLNPKDIGIREFRTLSYLLQHALNTEQEEKVHWIAEALKGFPLSLEDQIMLDSYRKRLA
jgi:serine/threonine protein kinase/tetratricopeptide (TPR) repeat protein